jgi:hypothetical protein
MKNPYFKNRTIRHADLLTEAGFKIDLRWYRDNNPRLCNVNKLIYWIKDDITLFFFDYERVSLKRLLKNYELALKKSKS